MVKKIVMTIVSMAFLVLSSQACNTGSTNSGGNSSKVEFEICQASCLSVKNSYRMSLFVNENSCRQQFQCPAGPSDVSCFCAVEH